MADNVGITPGSGAKAASREVSYSGETAQMQVVGLATLAGADDGKTPTDVSEAAPLPVAAYGELIEAIEAMRMAVHSLTRSIGFAQPNPSGQPIFEARQPTAANFLATVSQGTAANLQASVNINANQTLANITQLGGYSAAHQIPATMAIACEQLRRNITVT
jgi:hypothetical protein